MRWFKHITRANQDEKMARLISELGMEGYGFYWLVLEIVAGQIEAGSNRTWVEYPIDFWRKSCGISAKKLRFFATFCANLGIFSVEISENSMIVDVPNLLKYRDEFSKKKERKSGQNPERVRTKDTDTETEADTEKKLTKKSERDDPEEQPSQPKQPGIVNEVIAAYHELLPMLPKCRSTGKVSKAIIARIKDDPQRKNVAWWQGYFAECAASDFLTGRKNDFHATLSWLTGPENMEKALNGQYLNAKPKNQQPQQLRIPTETIPDSELHKYISPDESAGWGMPQ